jgi:hypothetical protein
MKKTIIIALAVIGVITLLVAAYFWYAMGKPLYQPGVVREGKNQPTAFAAAVGEFLSELK